MLAQGQGVISHHIPLMLGRVSNADSI